MQRADDLAVCFALFLAVWAAFASVPRNGPDLDQRLIGLLSTQALAVDMPMAGSDGEQFFVGP